MNNKRKRLPQPQYHEIYYPDMPMQYNDRFSNNNINANHNPASNHTNEYNHHENVQQHYNPGILQNQVNSQNPPGMYVHGGGGGYQGYHHVVEAHQNHEEDQMGGFIPEPVVGFSGCGGDGGGANPPSHRNSQAFRYTVEPPQNQQQPIMGYPIPNVKREENNELNVHYYSGPSPSYQSPSQTFSYTETDSLPNSSPSSQLPQSQQQSSQNQPPLSQSQQPRIYHSPHVPSPRHHEPNMIQTFTIDPINNFEPAVRPSIRSSQPQSQQPREDVNMTSTLPMTPNLIEDSDGVFSVMGAVPNSSNCDTAFDRLTSNQYLYNLRELERQIKAIRIRLSQRNLQNVEEDLVKFRLKIDEYTREIENLKSTHFLRIADFNNLLSLEEFINSSLSPQLALYEQDLRQIERNENLNTPLLLLTILNQQIAGPIKKEKPIGPVSLRLMTGATISQVQTGPVQPELVETSQKIKRNNQELENAKQTFKENGTATFSDLKFASGTFPNLVRLKFRVTVELQQNGSRINKTIESLPSKPFISMTNTGSQWKDAAGTWLREECFMDKFEISTARLWNYFQKHYLIATKQELNNIKRPLFVKDFDYLLQAKFKQGIEHKKKINQKEFQIFWDWIGLSLKKIRYQKYMLWLFENGYIPCFVTGREAEDQLKTEPQGTFLIRLSERVDGEFVISYTHQTGVRHYLLQPDDMADKKKTLVDLLGQNQLFLFIIQIQTNRNGKRVFYRHFKDKILQKYYKKTPKHSAKNQATDGNPYDTRLPDSGAFH